MMKQQIKGNQLFDSIYQLPLPGDEIKSYSQLQQKVKYVSQTLIKYLKNNFSDIEKVCNGNGKLLLVARLLRENNLPEGGKDINFSTLITSIISMFTLMMVSQKTMDFFNKINIPLSLYRILVKNYSQRGRIQFLRKSQVQETLKFISKMINIRVKAFPRLYALLIYNLICDCNFKTAQKQYFQCVISIAIDLIKCYLKLSAQCGVLIIMYKKALEADLLWNTSNQLLQVIIDHMNLADNRDIILSHLDLTRAFSIFTYVDPRPKQERYQQKVQTCAKIVQMLLSSTPTLFYLLYEKTTIKHFVGCLSSRNKSEKQLSIINDKIYFKILDRALRYDTIKMQRSNNMFGLKSNYLNLKSLMIMSFLLDNTNFFDIYLSLGINKTIRDLGKLSLRYFPITFEKQKYNKQIIQSIGLPSMKIYEHLDQTFLNILSYSNDCILNYQFTKEQFLGFLLIIKNQHVKQPFLPQYLINAVENLMDLVKKSLKGDNMKNIIILFYETIVDVAEYLEWIPQYLKLSKFLSLLFYHPQLSDSNKLHRKCVSTMKKIFQSPQPFFYRKLYVTLLDDIGRHLNDHQTVKQLVHKYISDRNYSFRISRILFHMEFDRKQSNFNLCQKDLLAEICEKGCEQLILLGIEIIKYYFHENDERAEWGTKIICKKLLYHQSEQIVSAAVQFCEQIAASKARYFSILLKIKLQEIKYISLRKRLMYLFICDQSGIDKLNEMYPKFLHQELELWIKDGSNMIKDFAAFFDRQCKRYTLNKQATNCVDVGTVNENRHRLIFLPWNVKINGEYFIGLCSYKYLKEKIKVRVCPMMKVQSNLEITFFYLGSLPILQNIAGCCVIVKKEQVQKNYERIKERENKQIKKFVVSRDNVLLFFSYENGDIILQKISSQIMLSKYVYMPIVYPLSFIRNLSKTHKGMNILREHKLRDSCVRFIKEEKDVEIAKGALEVLGILFISNWLEPLEKIQIYETVSKCFEETINYELKEVGIWVLNIIIKDEDFGKKFRQNKGWLILQSKYCGWICYPQFYSSKGQKFDKYLKRYTFLQTLLPEKLSKTPIIDQKGYNLIMKFLDTTDIYDKKENQKNERIQKIQKQNKLRRSKMLEYFKNPNNIDISWNPKTLERFIQYLSCIDHGIQKTKEVIEVFGQYYLHPRFDKQFPSGLLLP